MSGPYPHMIRMKSALQRIGVKRLGSKDCGVKKLTAVGETRWVSYGSTVNMSPFYDQAKGALEWLDQHCHGAWRYGAQQRMIDIEVNGRAAKQVELRHKVQFENPSDAILFKLSYRP